MVRIHGICAILCTLLAAACVGGSGIGDSSGESTPEGKACAAVAKATCDKFASCSPILLKAGFLDATSCASRKALACTAELSAAEASDTDVAKYTACAAKLASVTCDDFLNGKLPPDCTPDPGALEGGKPCGANAQCSSTYCNRPANATCGVCAAKSPAGGACAGSAGCSAGLACVDGACVALGAIGAPCSATQPCGAELYCADAACEPAGKVDDVCTGAAESSCDFYSGAQCNAATMTCEALKFAAVGQPCGSISGGTVLCGGGANCNKGAAPTGTCVAQVADGAACDEAKALLCKDGATCVKGVCTPFDPATCK